ncbi:AAA family ATPase [Rhizobium tubonense]|uniref:AAA+ ATPase domain-containing protein n=1 Tax=Rhizobium tubonense TaxID=484088 RepID=A0A2W4ETP3_9HYPH|nr:AAA family ATPase [Rhizobium tubonense]PZM13720.1 hypothetical protein CPY51_12605 [Rhizobium tubonense]
MKHKMTASAFKELAKHLGFFIAYCVLRRALRGTLQFRGNAGGLMIVVVDRRWIERFQRAAELLLSGRRRTIFNTRTSGRAVVVFETGSKRKIDIDWLSPRHQTMVVTDSLKALPQNLRLTADVIVTVEKPTARHLMAARKLAGRSAIDAAAADGLAKQGWDAIGALVGRQSFEKIDFANLAAAQGEVHDAPRLSELPGFGPARQWAAELVADLALWRAGQLAWSEIDKAALLMGPPGVGKTLFAATLAAELKIPLVLASVGKWQSTDGGYLGDTLRAMRASFAEAKSKSCAVLLIDELDGIGNRSHSSQYQFYEANVVNNFLELTGGLDTMEGVILLGATNRPADIDPAILRAGRFEKHIEIGLPDPEERAAILAFHLGGGLAAEKIRPVTDLLHDVTPADLGWLARRSKRIARGQKRAVQVTDIEASLPRRIYFSDDVLRRIATHECGHAIVAMTSGFVDVVSLELQDSILEGGSIQSGGRTRYDINEPMLPTEHLLRAKIRIALAGMAAEEVVQGSRSIGAGGIMGSDLDNATQIATRMVASYGFGKVPRFDAEHSRVGESYRPPPEIRAEIDAILAKEWKAVKELLTREKGRLMRLTAELVVDRRIELRSFGKC